MMSICINTHRTVIWIEKVFYLCTVRTKSNYVKKTRWRSINIIILAILLLLVLTHFQISFISGHMHTEVYIFSIKIMDKDVHTSLNRKGQDNFLKLL